MTDNGQLEKSDVVLPGWAVKLFGYIVAPIVVSASLATFAWVWSMNADMAVLKRDVAEIKIELRGRSVSGGRDVAIEGFR